MYFVIQVVSKSENKMMEKIKLFISDSSIMNDIFIPRRKRLRKNNGKWKEYEEICFPGYIFVETNKPRLLQKELRKIEGFTKLVGFGDSSNISFMPLTEQEANMIDRLMGKNDRVIGLSTIEFEEGNRIKVIDGPLEGFKGSILKYNIHKRTVMVRLEIGNIVSDLQLGIDLVEKDD